MKWDEKKITLRLVDEDRYFVIHNENAPSYGGEMIYTGTTLSDLDLIPVTNTERYRDGGSTVYSLADGSAITIFALRFGETENIAKYFERRSDAMNRDVGRQLVCVDITATN